MALVRYNPWQELNAHLSHINGLLGDTRVPSARLDRDFIKVPAAELHETDDALHLKLELPGIDAKDLDIQVTENAVYVSGERKSETTTENNGTKSA
jgi:HSP20 family protein